MRRKDESKKPIIADFINAFYYEHDKVPSVREIVEGTGIPLSTVHRYLVDMQEKGELSYNGYRSARTKEMSEVSPIHGIAVLGTVACGPGQEEEQRFIETIRMPETLCPDRQGRKHDRRGHLPRRLCFCETPADRK